MKRLSLALVILLVLFSTAVSLLTAALWNEQWVYAAVGGGIFIGFVLVGGALVPPARAAIAEGDRKLAGALLQAFGALCTLEVLICGLLLWIWGNRGHSGSNSYGTLGLLIFLALLGVGAQAALGTLFRFLYLRNIALIDRRQSESGSPT